MKTLIVLTVYGGFIEDRCRIPVMGDDLAAEFAGWLAGQRYVVYMEEMLEQNLPARSPREHEVASILTRQFDRSRA